ncbi:MAG: hypothetical protein JNK07_04840 [Alphaproteobacteria bacterium]|nr:hypothetical protein [Alphaproteobacteria bacterium]
MNIEEIVAQALETPRGLGFTLPDALAARRLRKAFYALRERRRRTGDTTWDCLAVVLPVGTPGVVHLVKKAVVKSVPATRQHAVAEAWPLSPLQLPRRLSSRGRRPLSLLALPFLAGGYRDT